MEAATNGTPSKPNRMCSTPTVVIFFVRALAYAAKSLRSRARFGAPGIDGVDVACLLSVFSVDAALDLLAPRLRKNSNVFAFKRPLSSSCASFTALALITFKMREFSSSMLDASLSMSTANDPRAVEAEAEAEV